MLLDQFLDLLINANIIILIAAMAFLIVEACLAVAGFRRSYSTRLWLLTASLGFAALLPLLSYFGSVFHVRAGPHVSEILITQYLKGNIAISAVNFDNLLSARSSAFQAIHEGSSFFVVATVSLILAGFFGRCAYILLNIVRIRSLLRNGHCVRSTNSIKIIVSSDTNVPFTTRGIWKYFVIVPETLLGDYETFSIAIGHEFQHIRQRDVTMEFLLAICSPFFVFNPFFWIMSQKLRMLREHTCDIEYLSRSRVTTREYARALLNVAKKATLSHRMNRIGSLSVPLLGRGIFFRRSTKSQLASRVLAFSDDSNRKPHGLFAVTLVVMGSMLMLLGTSAFQPNSGWSHDRIMISSVANLERLSLRNQAMELAAISE